MRENFLKFSVLMSVYYKENPIFLRQALNSIFEQNVLCDEFILVKDGPIGIELDEVINCFISLYPDLFKIISLNKNMGLGYALNIGVLACKNELIARMDSDDICIHNRFELQLEEFRKNPTLGILGGQIYEFLDNPGVYNSIRKVPILHDDIVRYQKRRTAFNHMTVMYKRSEVLKAGNYENYLYIEDSVLWAKMLQKGVLAHNLPEVIVKARVGNGLQSRRSSFNYFKYYRSGRLKMLKEKQISMVDYVVTNFAQLFLSLIPINLRRKISNKFLRKSCNKDQLRDHITNKSNKNKRRNL